ncbi:dTDP-4-dehydrorhamnose 3,5-epimerase [Paenibacillus sp. CC-CFT747]|nr:dTDP-4-dehydrorhamnose 3,5-epimerase [Paenibacillus sp. CC-CFT747]
MKRLETKLEGVVILEPAVYGDHRGFFTESYNRKNLAGLGIELDFVQDNHSYSAEAGTLRGLHYQLNPMAQTKLVRVTAGAVYDVAVDIREGSPTYGEWVGVILSEANHRQLLIPAGFAHGFCTITPHTHVSYKVTEYYSAEHDRGIRWDDPELAIPWPVTRPVLSDKDGKHPGLREAEAHFPYREVSLT